MRAPQAKLLFALRYALCKQRKSGLDHSYLKNRQRNQNYFGMVNLETKARHRQGAFLFIPLCYDGFTYY